MHFRVGKIVRATKKISQSNGEVEESAPKKSGDYILVNPDVIGRKLGRMKNFRESIKTLDIIISVAFFKNHKWNGTTRATVAHVTCRRGHRERLRKGDEGELA
jgi:hypothetical protein